MARVYTYTMIAVAIILMFQFFLGWDVGAQSISDLLNLAQGDISFGDFVNGLFGSVTGILTLTGLALGLTVGLLLRGQLENFMILPFITSTLFAMIGVFTALLQNADQFGQPWSALFTLLLVPFMIGYVISLLEFFRGNV